MIKTVETLKMNKGPRPKLSESDLELFNKVVADVKPLKSQDKSFINRKNSVNKMVKLEKINMISREIRPIKHVKSIPKGPIVINDHSPGRAPGRPRGSQGAKRDEG